MTKYRTRTTAIQEREDSYKLQFCSLFSLSFSSSNMEATPWGFPVPIVRTASSCLGSLFSSNQPWQMWSPPAHYVFALRSDHGKFSEAQPRHGLMNYLPRRHLVNPLSCRGSAFWRDSRPIAHPGGQTSAPPSFPCSNQLEFHCWRLVFQHLCPPSTHSTLCLQTPANDGRPDELLQGLLAVVSDIYPSCTKTECDIKH